MNSLTDRKWLLPALLVGAAVVAFLAFGVFGVHTLFIDEEVNEAAPVFTTTEDDEAGEDDGADAADNDPDGDAMDDDGSMDDDGAEPAETNGDAMADDDHDESADSAQPGTVATGDFVDGDHPTSGTAVVLSDGGTQRVLRLEEDFATDNGPDLNVYLASSADDFGDTYIDLGDLKGNIGSQNYELPEDIDLSVYDTVVIWCVRFGVGFGSAELA